MQINHLKLILCFLGLLFVFSCKENDGVYLKVKDAGLSQQEKDRTPAGDPLLPAPPDDDGDDSEEPEKEGLPEDDGGGDDEKDPLPGDGSDDGSPGDKKSCPKKVEIKINGKGKDAHLDQEQIQSFACEDGRTVAICHQTSPCKSKVGIKYKVLLVDYHSIAAHLSHKDEKDFLIDCSKINFANIALGKKKFDEACNCKEKD